MSVALRKNAWMENPTRAAHEDLALMGGVLVCDSCAVSRPIGDADDIGRWSREGWPMCCGYTMRWITERELGGAPSRFVQ